MVTALDGNAAAGALQEVFAFDVTTASLQCAGCGDTNVLSRARVYLDAPGLVIRCPGCDGIVLRYVRGSDRGWLDLRGSTCVQLDL